MRVVRGLDAPAHTTRYLVLAVPHRPTSTHDVHGAVNPVENRDSTTQATPVLDLEDEVEQAVTIKVTDRVHGIELGRQHESGCSHSAVCPERNTSERASGKLSTRGKGLKYENCRKEEFGAHGTHTCAWRSSFKHEPAAGATAEGRGPTGTRKAQKTVEARGIEPRSEHDSDTAPTCVDKALWSRYLGASSALVATSL